MGALEILFIIIIIISCPSVEMLIVWLFTLAVDVSLHSKEWDMDLGGSWWR